MDNSPTLFEWLSQIIIPSFVGLATIFIAFSSFSSARKSNKTAELALDLAQLATKSEESREMNRERQATFDLVVECSAARWHEFQKEPQRSDAETRGKLAKAVLRLTQLEDLSSKQLALVLNSYEDFEVSLNRFEFGILCGIMQVQIKSLLVIWLNIPNSDSLLKKIAGDGPGELLERVKKQAKEFEQIKLSKLNQKS